MSTTLVFWRGGDALDPNETYQLLNEGRQVDTVTDLVADDVEATLRTGLPGWTHDANLLQPPGAPAGGTPAIDVMIGAQHVVFTAYGATGDQLNEIIDAMLELGLRLYDPQLGERFQ